MEKREEIKDGVKQRLIEFMAEQITKEESFADLKSELIQEFLFEKKIKNAVVEKTTENLTNLNLTNKLDGTFLERMAASKEQADQFINNKMDKQGELIKKIFDIKTGNEPVNLKKFMNTELEKDSTKYKDVIEMIEGDGLKETYKPEVFNDYMLRHNYSEDVRTEMRKRNLFLLKRSLGNQPDGEFHIFNVKSFSEGDNERKEYLVDNKVNKFKLTCSYIHNTKTKEKYIDTLSVDSGGFLIQNEDLGVHFAIQAIELMDDANTIKQESAKNIKEKLHQLFKPDKDSSDLS